MDVYARQLAEPGVRPHLTVRDRRAAVMGYFGTVYKRTWRGTTFQRFVSPVLFMAAMGVGLGTLVDRSAGGVQGQTYLHFVVPAIVCFQAMMAAMGESTYLVLAYIKWNQMYAAMLATPLTLTDVLAGHLLVVAGHLLMGTTLFVVLAWLLGGFATPLGLATIPVGVLTGLAFAVPVFAYSARQDGDDGFNILYRLVVTPIMLFSGTFFPVSQLPLFLQPLAWVTPLWHGVELARSVAYGHYGWLDLVHLGVLVAFVVGGWFLARWSFTKRLVR